VLVVTALLGFASPLAAQSLVDVAKQEEARRKTVKETGKETKKIFSNKDLPQVAPPPQVVSSGDGKETPAADAGAAAPAVGDKKDTDKKDTEVRDEEYWRKRITTARQQLDRDITFAAAMQSRINALSTDFVNRDDPAQRAVIAGDRDRAMSELKALEKSIENDKATIASIEEEARRANVPAGWLR
jgi:hypothetical protein